MPRASSSRSKRKAAASVDLPASSNSSTRADTLQLPKRPHNAGSRRVYAPPPVSPLLSPKLPLPAAGKEQSDQPLLEYPSEFDSELLPPGLSQSPDRFGSPRRSYHSVRPSTLSPVHSTSPFRPSPCSPTMLGLVRTPNKRRYSPDASFLDLSPLSASHSSQYPPRHCTPRSKLDSPASNGSSSLFRSPHPVTPRSSRHIMTRFSSPASSRVRSLAPSLNVLATDNSLQLPPVLPSPLGEQGASGDSLQQLPTPRALFTPFAWSNNSRNNSSASGDVLFTPTHSRLAASPTSLSPPQQHNGVRDESATVAIEYGEDSVDSLASAFSRTARSLPHIPPFFASPARRSHRTSSILSSRTQLRTPSSSHSRASTSSSASKKASFSILASCSSAELSCVALGAEAVENGGSGKARQRLTFTAEEPQPVKPQPATETADAAAAVDQPGVKVEPIEVVEETVAVPPSLLSTPPRSRMTEFVMADDGLRETPTAQGEAAKRLLFAYRASADGHAPNDTSSASPHSNSPLSLRPRSYTFATRKDGKVNVSSTPPFSQLDRVMLSPSSAALFTPPSPSPSAGSFSATRSTADTHSGGAPLTSLISSFSGSSASLFPRSQSEYDDRSSPLSLSGSLHPSPSSCADVISVDGQPVKAKSCNCKKSKCLKLYCECFAHGRVCIDCNCSGCHNTDRHEHQPEREKAVAATRERDSNAFYRAAPLQARAEKLKARARAASRLAASATTPPRKPTVGATFKTEDGVDPATPVTPAAAAASSAEITASAASSNVVAVEESAVQPAAPLDAPSTAAPAAAAAPTATPTDSSTPGPADSAAASTAAPPPPPPPAGGSALPARKGCNCRKSKCLKKYCECFQLGLKCTARCKCTACLNGNQHTHDEPPQPDDKAAESANQQASTKEAGESSSGKEDRVRGAFVQVQVASHLSCTSGDGGGSPGSAADSAAVDAATPSRPPPGASKLSAWRLVPGGSGGGSASVPPLSNAPPIPVQPLAPFTLPAPFEMFHRLKSEAAADNEMMVQC